MKLNHRKEDEGLSESERRRRKNYKRNRNNLIIIQAAVIALLALFSSFFFITYTRISDTYEIPYTESGEVDYTVNLLPNDDYEEDSIGPGFSYIASLIDTVSADFSYTAGANSPGAKYEYSYSIIARIEITNNENGRVIFEHEDVLKEVATQALSGAPIRISESVDVDFSAYDAEARSFLKRYGLGNVTPRLVVSLVTDAKIREENLNCEGESSYVAEMIMPLARTQVDVEVKKSLSASDVKLLVSDDAKGAKNGFLTASVTSGGLAALALVVLVVFIFLTRNHDINYSIKVKRILNAYRSYIQKINNAFDTDGYQVLYVDTFSEMLSIRDTLQSPILMNENEDETKTVFIIPTAARMLYLYEIKVENYDEIYASRVESEAFEHGADESAPCEPCVIELFDEAVESDEPIAEETACEVCEPEPAVEKVPELEIEIIDMNEPAVEEAIPEPAVEEVVPEPAVEGLVVETESMPENIVEPVATAENSATVGDDTRIIDGQVVHVRYRTSFASRLAQTEPIVKEYYSTVKNQLLFYDGVKARTSWNFESFKKTKIQCAKLNIKGATLFVYLALDPKEYNANKYYFTDVSDKPKLADVPMLLKVKSERSLKYALELIDEMMAKAGIELIGGPAKNYCPPYETTEALIAKDLIKVLLPAGETLGRNSVIEPTDVSEIIRDAKEQEPVLVAVAAVEAKADSEPVKTLEEAINEAMATPDVVLSEVDFVDEAVETYEETEDKPGVEVIGVVWPERKKNNKIYKYDPDGEVLSEGDVVLVPTHDTAKKKDVIRKAAVARGNYKVESEKLTHPLKKIISVVKRKIENALSAD